MCWILVNQFWFCTPLIYRVDNFSTLLEEQQATEAETFQTFNERLEDIETKTAKIMEAFRGAMTPDSQS